MIIRKLNRAGAGLALATVLPFAASIASAAGDDYKFEAIGGAPGAPLTVHLIDETTGQPIADAHVFAVHRQWRPKGEPQFIDRRIALAPDGQGGFTYRSPDMGGGSTVRLVAQIDGNDTDIWGSVRIGQ